MKKFFTSMFLMAMFAVNAMAQDLTYEFTSFVGAQYQGFTATVDSNAVEAALGCKLSEASAFAVLSDQTEDPDYQLGTTDGWRDGNGDWLSWGQTATRFCVKADFTLATEQIYYIGGMQNTVAETYTATYKLYNPAKTKSMNIFVKLNYVNAPGPYKLTDLSIVGQSEVTVTQYPRSTTKTDWAYVEIKDLASKIGAEDLSSFDGLIFAKDIVSETGAWNDSVGCHGEIYFAQFYDEATGKDLEECGYDDANDKFFVYDFQYDADTLWFEIGQESNQCVANNQYFGYVYIVKGTKAYQLKVTLKVEPKPEGGGFKDMTKVGETTISLKREIALGYATTSVDLDVETIKTALGVDDLASATFKAFSSEAKDELTDSYTTSADGFWMDMHSIPMSWNTSVQSYFVDSNLDDGAFEIGHMPGIFEGGEKADGSLFLTFGNNYYEFVMDIQIGDEPDPEAKTPEDCKTVATVTYEYEIVPSASTYPVDGTIDLDNDWITATLGGTATFYGMKENKDATKLEFSTAYSCDPNPGFWMIVPTGEYQFNTSTVGTWGSSCTYGICYADGVLSFYQYPGSRSVGDTYDSDFYLVNISEAKKIKVHLTISYVEVRAPQKTVVGTSEYTVAASEDGEETAIENLADIYAALGCDADEFEATGEITGALTATKYLNKENGYYDDTYPGFPCNASGYIVNPETAKPEDIVFYLGCEDGKFIVTVLDEAVLATNKYTGHIGFEFGENRYVCNVSFGNGATGINAISLTNQTSGKTYNLAGQAVDGSFKGIVIRNGQKKLVK